MGVEFVLHLFFFLCSEIIVSIYTTYIPRQANYRDFYFKKHCKCNKEILRLTTR